MVNHPKEDSIRILLRKNKIPISIVDLDRVLLFLALILSSRFFIFMWSGIKEDVLVWKELVIFYMLLYIFFCCLNSLSYWFRKVSFYFYSLICFLLCKLQSLEEVMWIFPPLAHLWAFSHVQPSWPSSGHLKQIIFSFHWPCPWQNFCTLIINLKQRTGFRTYLYTLTF